MLQRCVTLKSSLRLIFCNITFNLCFPFRQKSIFLFCEKGVFTVMLDFYFQLNKEKNAHDTTKSRLKKNEKQFKQLNRGEESMTYFDKVWFFFSA